MRLDDVAFGTTDWSEIEPATHRGAEGVAIWRTREFGGIRVRMVDYSAGYVADHWCTRGHVLLCLEGTLETELEDGRTFTLTPGVSYQVNDGAEPHRSRTVTGARLFVVD
jgi:quercetin dioxygenase-like cupin family protein